MSVRTESLTQLRATVGGIGFWSSHLPGWALARTVMRSEAEALPAPAPRPQSSLLPPAERRRAPDTLAVALEVALQACQSAQLEPRGVASVFASMHGDLAISDYMCETLASTPTLISPIRFHNSVHNAAAGYWAIATGSRASYTSLTAAEYTFGAGLLEALTQVTIEGAPVLYVAYDIAARGPMTSVAPSVGLLGAALVLCPAAPNRAAPQLLASVATGIAPQPTVAHSPAAAVTADNSMSTSVPLFEALAGERSCNVVVALSAHAALDISLQWMDRA